MSIYSLYPRYDEKKVLYVDFINKERLEFERAIPHFRPLSYKRYDYE